MAGGDYKIRETDRGLLRTFVNENGGRVFTEVPVAGHFPPWESSTSVTSVDAVWFPNARPQDVVSWADQPESFKALAESEPATLVSARGYLDRTAFGMLLAGRLLFGRTYSPPSRCVALAEMHYPNVERVYAEHGLEVEIVSDEISGEAVRSSRGGGREDPLLLMHYARHYGGRGTLLTEARIPPWRVDALWCEEGHMTVGECHDVSAITPGSRVELIEVKPQLNTDVIGQAVAGATRLRQIVPHLGDVPAQIVVGSDPNQALDWVCEQIGVDVYRY